MKTQKICGFFLLALLPSMLKSQDLQRSPTAEQSLELRQGALSNFDEYLFRFESAREDGDLKSMEILRKKLLDMMQHDLAPAPASQKPAPTEPDLAAWYASARDADLALRPETASQAFQQYKTWKEKKLAAEAPAERQ